MSGKCCCSAGLGGTGMAPSEGDSCAPFLFWACPEDRVSVVEIEVLTLTTKLSPLHDPCLCLFFPISLLGLGEGSKRSFVQPSQLFFVLELCRQAFLSPAQEVFCLLPHNVHSAQGNGRCRPRVQSSLVEAFGCLESGPSLCVGRTVTGEQQKALCSLLRMCCIPCACQEPPRALPRVCAVPFADFCPAALRVLA